MTFESAVSLSRMRRYRTVATDRISSRWSGSTHVDAAASLDDSSAAPAKIGGTAIKGVCFTFPCVTLLPLLPELDGEVRLLPVQEGIVPESRTTVWDYSTDMTFIFDDFHHPPADFL
jgi:hypothetical protein